MEKSKLNTPLSNIVHRQGATVELDGTDQMENPDETHSEERKSKVIFQPHVLVNNQGVKVKYSGTS